ncbi:MAG: hypothetical protein V2I43_17365 [Parvularcula sp.]|jgi:hypothetical protein|nr:hypothetical protein [Parvularcula sp.]
MHEDLNQTEARQGTNRRFQWRVLWISTALTAVVLFAAYLVWLAIGG